IALAQELPKTTRKFQPNESLRAPDLRFRRRAIERVHDFDVQSSAASGRRADERPGLFKDLGQPRWLHSKIGCREWTTFDQATYSTPALRCLDVLPPEGTQRPWKIVSIAVAFVDRRSEREPQGLRDESDEGGHRLHSLEDRVGGIRPRQVRVLHRLGDREILALEVLDEGMSGVEARRRPLQRFAGHPAARADGPPRHDFLPLARPVHDRLPDLPDALRSGTPDPAPDEGLARLEMEVEGGRHPLLPM